jgi:hypothetical protein
MISFSRCCIFNGIYFNRISDACTKIQIKNSTNFAYTIYFLSILIQIPVPVPTPTAHCPFTISVMDVRLLPNGFPRKMSQYFVTTKKWRYEILYSKNLQDISKDIRMLNYGKTFATLTPAMAVSMMKQRSRKVFRYL